MTDTISPARVAPSRHAVALLSGHWVSVLGSRLFFVAVAWFLTVQLGVAASSWALAVFQFLPTLVMMPITLALVDLVGRRRLVITSDIARASICFVGAGIALAGHIAAGLLFAVVIVRLFDTLYSPSIRAGVTEAAGRFGRFSPQYLLLLLASSASLLAPLLVPAATTLPVAAVLVVNGATYLVSLIGCAYGGRLMDASGPSSVSIGQALGRWRQTIQEGWREFSRVAVLRHVVPTLPLIDMSYAALVVVLPAIAMATVGDLDAGWYYAVLVLIYGISRIVGAELGRRYVHRKRDGAFLALNCSVQGCLYLLAAAAGTTWVLLVAIAVIGILSGAATLSVNEIVSDAVPSEARGRVFALIGFAVVALIPLGPAISGLASGVSPALTLAIVGALLLLAGLLPMTSRRVWSFTSPPKAAP